MDPGGSERHQVWALDMESLTAKKLTRWRRLDPCLGLLLSQR